MAIYLGSNNKLKINMNGVVYHLNLYNVMPVINTIRLLSSDEYILTDSTGVFLIPKDYTPPVSDSVMALSYDGYMLTDINGLYLTIKEEN